MAQAERKAIRYCGCCGRENTGPDESWCPDCVPHVNAAGAPWERTYLARTGHECPFQAGASKPSAEAPPAPRPAYPGAVGEVRPGGFAAAQVLEAGTLSRPLLGVPGLSLPWPEAPGEAAPRASYTFEQLQAAYDAMAAHPATREARVARALSAAPGLAFALAPTLEAGPLAATDAEGAGRPHEVLAAVLSPVHERLAALRYASHALVPDATASPIGYRQTTLAQARRSALEVAAIALQLAAYLQVEEEEARDGA